MAAKVNHLVVDSAAFFGFTTLQDIGDNIYTVEGVISEIKDKKTRERLQFLPYDLKIRKPSEEAIRFVTDFSKKTGDYPGLSATDILLLALAYQIQKEEVGTANLHDTPKDIVYSVNEKQENVQMLPGFFRSSSEASEEEVEEEEGWLTPDNIQSFSNKLNIDSDEVVEVGCITKDFSMQNVLMQLGIRVIAVDGKIIRSARNFILRCHACFKTTADMNKVFCPQCGNKTLKRVAFSIDENGERIIHLSFRKPINIRGTKFPLPLPQGGKYATNPILTEDQRIPQQRISNMARKKNNVLDPDYIAGSSPFVTRDVTSKSANLGIKGSRNFSKRNPNESSRKQRKK